MIIMALDHTRDYFHFDAFFFDPEDLTQTNIALYWTRFVTHFCAPVFVFLAGTSAFFVGQRKTKKQLSIWLLQRGFWLAVLELTVVRFGWLFNLEYSEVFVGVIWILGVSMICLSALIHLPSKFVIVVSLLAVFSHNFFDSFMPAEPITAILWSFLHVQGVLDVDFIDVLRVGYPLIPWIFVMPLGYHFGNLYRPTVSEEYRAQKLWQMGLACVVAFVALRASNLYGDSIQWSAQDSFGFTLLSFFQVTKYPPSLLFLLITLGPSLIFLSMTERLQGRVSKQLAVVGRVPLFFYVVHIYVIHLAAVVAAVLTGYSFSDMIIDYWVTVQPELQGYGFGLWAVYAFWIVLVVTLYPMCAWYDAYKQSHKDNRWLSYL